MSIPIVFCLGIRGVVYSDVFRAEYYTYGKNIPREYHGISRNISNIPNRIPTYRARNIRLFAQCNRLEQVVKCVSSVRHIRCQNLSSFVFSASTRVNISNIVVKILADI